MTRCPAHIVPALQCYLRAGHDGSHMAHHLASGHDYSWTDEWGQWGWESSESSQQGT